MQDPAQGSSDCARIDIEVADPGAALTLFTLDGRLAMRPIGSPEELVPTAEALLVEAPPAEAFELEEIEIAADTAPPRSDTAWVLRTGGGAHFGQPGNYTVPMLIASGGFVRGGWETSLHAQLDVPSTPLGTSTPSELAVSSFAIGGSLGRRVPAGQASLLIGAQVALHSLRWRPTSSDAARRFDPVRGATTDLSIGLYIGSVLLRD